VEKVFLLKGGVWVGKRRGRRGVVRKSGYGKVKRKGDALKRLPPPGKLEKEDSGGEGSASQSDLKKKSGERNDAYAMVSHKAPILVRKKKPALKAGKMRR